MAGLPTTLPDPAGEQTALGDHRVFLAGLLLTLHFI